MDLFDSEGKRLSSATGTNASIRINVRYEPMHTFSNTQAATGPICWRGLIDGAFVQRLHPACLSTNADECLCRAVPTSELTQQWNEKLSESSESVAALC